MSTVSDIMDPLGSMQPSSTDTGSELQSGEAALLDPSGKPMAFPSHLVPTLMQQGFVQDTPENRNKAELRRKYGESPILAAGAGAARGASLGLSDQLLTKTGLVHKETLKALDEYNPVASTVGNVAGAVGSSLLAPELSPLGMIGKLGAGTAEALGGGVAAKLAGSAVEGAFYGLGQTATEQALGDPDLTAQKVIANIGLGALLNAGTTGAFHAIAGLGRKAGGGEGLLSKFNNTMLGTPEADTAYYLANQEAVQGAPEVGAIKDVIDDHVSKVQQAYEQSKGARDNALADVKAMQPDGALATDVHAAMEEQKKALGQKGEELEAVLERSGIQVPAEVVQHAINEQKNALQIGGSVFGASNNATKKYLDDLTLQVVDLPETLGGSELRQVVRSLREDGASAYGLGAGEFSEGKGKAAAGIAEGLNQHIRSVPEAAAILDDMRSRIQALEGMRTYFGTADRAVSNLQQAAGDSAKNELRLQALQQFDKATGSNFVTRLKPYQDAHQVMSSIKSGASPTAAVGSIANPGPELQALAQISAGHETDAAAFDAIKRLSSGRSQSVIESYMSKTAKAGESGMPPKFSIEDAKALEHLASIEQADHRLAGQTIYDAMRARGVLDRFASSKANGSRHAVMLGTLGGAIGGAVGHVGAGAAIGSAVGGAIDRQGGQAAKRIMDAVLMAQKAGNKGVTTQLGQLVLNKIGPAAIMGMKASTISEILQHLQNQNSSDPRQEQRARSLGQLERHSNTTTSRLEAGVQKFFKGGQVETKPQFEGDTKDTIEDVRKLAANPEELLNRVHSQTSGLSDMAPKVTQGVNDTALRAVQFLAGKIPPPSNSLALDGTPPHSKSALADFRTALDVVNDPLTVLKHAKNGTLSNSHLEALNAVYPHLASEIKSHALNELAGQEAKKLPFAKKTALSRLVGSPLVRQLSPDAMAAAQASMAQTVAQDNQSKQGTARPSQKGLSNLDVSSRAKTDFQQTTDRRKA